MQALQPQGPPQLQIRKVSTLNQRRAAQQTHRFILGSSAPKTFSRATGGALGKTGILTTDLVVGSHAQGSQLPAIPSEFLEPGFRLQPECRNDRP